MRRPSTSAVEWSPGVGTRSQAQRERSRVLGYLPSAGRLHNLLPLIFVWSQPSCCRPRVTRFHSAEVGAFWPEAGGLHGLAKRKRPSLCRGHGGRGQAPRTGDPGVALRCRPGLHGRYEQGANLRSAVPWRPPCASHALPANGSSQPLFRPSRRCSRCMASKNRSRIAVAGCAASRWYPDTPENHLPLPLHAMFGFTRSVLQAVPISRSSSLHSPAQPAHCDCSSAAPCTTNRPTSTLGLVATSILILIVARFSP